MNTTPNKCVWKLPTSTQLRATWHTDSLDMVVLPSTSALRYHNCCIDGGTSLENFGYHLVLWLVSDHFHTHHCSYHLLEDIPYWSTCLHVTCLSFSTVPVKSSLFLVFTSPHLKFILFCKIVRLLRMILLWLLLEWSNQKGWGWQGVCHVWGRGEVHTCLWYRSLRERSCLEGLGIDGGII